MGSVTFTGNVSDSNLLFRGIFGHLSSRDYDSIVKNCANYGDVTDSGSNHSSYIGGIVDCFD